MFDFLGGALGGLFGFLGQQDANQTNMQISQNNSAFNAAEAQENRNFQDVQARVGRDFINQQAENARAYDTYMSNSAYQRQVSDMINAGINPMLAAMKGGGASSPTMPVTSGPTASGSLAQAAPPPVIGNALGAGINSGAAMANLSGALQQLTASTDKTKAEAEKTRLESSVLVEQALADIKNKGASAAQYQEAANRMRQLVPHEQERFDSESNLANQRAWNEKAYGEAGGPQADAAERIARTRQAVAAAALSDMSTRSLGFKLSEDEAQSAFWKSPMGKLQPFLERGLGDVNSAASAAQKFMGRSFNETLIPRGGGGFARQGRSGPSWP